MSRYCECFSGSAPCTERCRCVECKNIVEYYGAASTSAATTFTYTAGSPTRIKNDSKVSSPLVSRSAGGGVVGVVGVVEGVAPPVGAGAVGVGAVGVGVGVGGGPGAEGGGISAATTASSLLELAGICEQQEATESLLALSPKPFQSQGEPRSPYSNNLTVLPALNFAESQNDQIDEENN